MINRAGFDAGFRSNSVILPGVTMIELLVYISLLAILVTVLFSFAWQMQTNQQKLLAKHADLHTGQFALELLGRDLSEHKLIKSKIKNSLICMHKQTKIEWQIDRNQNLWRIESSPKLKKPARSKVANDFKSLHATSKLIPKNQANLIQLKLVNQQNQVFAKTVLLRPGIQIELGEFAV